MVTKGSTFKHAIAPLAALRSAAFLEAQCEVLP
jgi:hypothetical protein